MEKVMVSGPWRIQLVPIILNVWMPNTLLKKEKVSSVPLWVKIHNVPIVAYAKVGLDLISAKVGRLMRLDAHTNFICLNSWGRSEYARALVEVSVEKPLVDFVDIDIPLEDGKGHATVNIKIEYEWQPPRCGICKKFDHLDRGVNEPSRPSTAKLELETRLELGRALYFEIELDSLYKTRARNSTRARLFPHFMLELDIYSSYEARLDSIYEAR
ncbi:zinc knuckle CX2CX4HX4C containing protein [Tanacetum coccineum]